jgi:hypothetical protein
MSHPIFCDRVNADLATEYMAVFGKSARREAAARAKRSRDHGNVLGFCRWREIERLIRVLDEGQGESTLH